MIVLGRLQQRGRHDVGVLLEDQQRAHRLRRDVPVLQVDGLAESGDGVAVGAVRDAPQVVERVGRVDDQRGIVFPLFGIPDPHVQRLQLRQRTRPGGRRHPRRGLDPLYERRADVVGDSVHALLLPGREVALDVHPPERIPHGRLRGNERPLGAGGRWPGQGGGTQRQRLLGKCARQHVRVIVDGMEAQVVLPGLQRLRRDLRREPRHGGRLPDDELVLPAKPAASTECGPSRSREPA